MQPPQDQIVPLTCAKCADPLDATDAYCRRCGTSVSEPRLPVYQSRVGVLFLLFLGIGPLALPLLWKSPAFTRPQKGFVTLLNLAFSLAIVWSLFWAYNTLLSVFTEVISSEPGF